MEFDARNPDSKFDVPSTSNSKLDKEVDDLIKNEDNVHEAWAELKKKYGDDQEFIHKAMTVYQQRKKRVKAKANRLKLQILQKYGNAGLSHAKLMKKAQKYAKKYKFNHSDMELFNRLLISENMEDYNEVYPATEMSKLLGFDTSYVKTSSKMNVTGKDASVVEEILSDYNKTKIMHHHVIAQALMYKDCDPIALIGEYDNTKFNLYNHIHPVIAALFLIKSDLLEERILLSNIGYIVDRKTKGLNIPTKPDNELYWALITGTEETVCSDSPIKDLRHRYKIQQLMWETVSNL